MVTGSASGIGKATASILLDGGHRVIGVDMDNAEVQVDLASRAGRELLYSKVSDASAGHIDAIVAVAGVAQRSSLAVRVNYFGAIATLESLRPLLSASAAPRAVVVSSFAALMATDTDLLRALAAGEEAAASAIADSLTTTERAATVYASSKRAIAEWVRLESISQAWAGAGIPLNAVAPGVTYSPMTAPMMEDTKRWDQLLASVPMPLTGRPAEPDAAARLLVWLAGEENTNVTGQVVFIDSGADALTRGAHVFG